MQSYMEHAPHESEIQPGTQIKTLLSKKTNFQPNSNLFCKASVKQLSHVTRCFALQT